MAMIIFILLLAFLAFLNGDPSGIEAIIKIIVVGAFVICIGFIVTEPVFWVIVGILFLIFVLYLMCSSISRNVSSKMTHIDIKEESEIKEIINESTVNKTTHTKKKNTGFKLELENNSRTITQVKSEHNLKISNEAQEMAKHDYNLIKNELLECANNGKYQIINEYKVITYIYKKKYRPSFIGSKDEFVYINRTFFNPGGEFANKVSIFIVDRSFYDCYISYLNRLSRLDDISIKPVIINSNNENDIHFLPCTIQGFGVYSSSYMFALKCEVKY